MNPDELTGFFTYRREAILAKSEAVSAALKALSSCVQNLPETPSADQPAAMQKALERLDDFRSGLWSDFKSLIRRPGGRTIEAFHQFEAALQMQEVQLTAAIASNTSNQLRSTGLEKAQRVLEEITERQQSAQRFFKLGPVLLWAIPAVVGYLIWAFYHLSSSAGLQMKECFVASPPMTFEQDRSGAFSMNERYQRKWFGQFSRYYFGRSVTDPDTFFRGIKVTIPPFTADDFRERLDLLVRPDPSHPLALALCNKLPAQTQQILNDPKAGAEQKARALAEALNQFVQSGTLTLPRESYANDVDSSELTEETKQLLAQKPTREGLARLNQILIATALQVSPSPEKDAAQLSFDVVFQNSARAPAVPLASLSGSVELAKRRTFPWNLVDASVHVEANKSEANLVTLRNTGIGKLRGLSYQGTFHSAVLYSWEIEQRNQEEPLPDSFTVHIDPSQTPDESRGFGQITLLENGEISPVYRKLDPSKETLPANVPVYQRGEPEPTGEQPQPDKSPFFAIRDEPNTYYETITTLKRLKEMTNVPDDRTVTYTFSYQSLRGDTQSGNFTLDLPPACRFFETKGGSLSAVSPLQIPAVAEAGPLPLLALVDNLIPVSDSTSKAENLIIQNFTIPARDLNEGVERIVSATPQKILNPGDDLLFHVSIPDFATGDYTLALHANGHALPRMPIKFSTLVPPSWRFKPADVSFFDPKYHLDSEANARD